MNESLRGAYKGFDILKRFNIRIVSIKIIKIDMIRAYKIIFCANFVYGLEIILF
jgi:hypothetical protein